MAQFGISTKVFFGKEGQSDVRSFLKSQNLNSLVFIVDQSIIEQQSFKLLIGSYESAGFGVQNIHPFDASLEPSYALLDEYMQNFRSGGFDAIVAVGGGSVLDLAKGVGILVTNPGRGIDYRGMNKVELPGVPVICYPTTAGTGSEVTHTAAFIDTDSKTKLGINGRHVSVLCGVLMPELTYSCPSKITINSGLDAMVHAIEAVSAKTANEVTSMLGSTAFALLYDNIKIVLEEPENYTARGNMLLGSYYAGIAMMNAGGGPASGISYPLGVHYRVPHGIAGGIFLQHVFDFNVAHGYTGYAEVYDRMKIGYNSLSPIEKSQEFVALFKKMYLDIGASQNLSDYNVYNNNIEFITQLTMEQRIANLELNPVPFGRGDVLNLLEKVT